MDKRMFLAAFFATFLMLMTSFAFAQLPEEITVKYCGNKKLDKYEVCEKGIKDFCPQLGMVLNRIVMACNERNCGCLPGRTAMDCGNKVREGAELCDAGVDFCPNLSQIMGLSLKCNSKTCLCEPAEQVSYCGDGKVQGVEDCEEDSDCSGGRYCSDCVCRDLDVGEKPAVSDNAEGNIGEEAGLNITQELEKTSEESDEADIEEVLEKEKTGFFKRIWLWIKGLFS